MASAPQPSDSAPITARPGSPRSAACSASAPSPVVDASRETRAGLVMRRPDARARRSPRRQTRRSSSTFATSIRPGAHARRLCRSSPRGRKSLLYQRIACTRRCVRPHTAKSRSQPTPGLHAEGRALLEHEGVLAQDGQEVVGIVASNVTDEGVEGAPARGIQGHREDDGRTVPRDPAELAEGLPVVLDVLDDVEGAHQVEAAIGKRQGGDLAERRETRAGLQTRERRSADVDEVRARDGEPRMQTRADLESRRRRRRERGEQRPGVEALRRDDVARRPERVVEASVRGDVDPIGSPSMRSEGVHRPRSSRSNGRSCDAELSHHLRSQVVPPPRIQVRSDALPNPR